MTETEMIKLECLRLAIASHSGSSAVTIAREYYQFVSASGSDEMAKIKAAPVQRK